jgi:tetratricopeptide (TPR) repeat protein
MIPQDIYKRLWSADEAFARNVLTDASIAPLLRVWALLKLRRIDEAKTVFVQQKYPLDNEFEEMLYKELELLFNFSDLSVSERRKRALSIVEHFPLSIYARLELAATTRKGEYLFARELYNDVLNLCPSNPQALAGIIKAYIYLGNRDQARSILKDIKQKDLFRENRYWGMFFRVYDLILGNAVALRLLLGIVVPVTAFLPPVAWIVPLVIFGIGIFLGIYFLPRDELIATFFFLLAFTTVLVWLIGLGAKTLFIKLEGYQ